MSEPRTPQVPMVDQNGQPFYPLTQYNQIVMPDNSRWDGSTGSTVELDTTLKVAGKAADAGAVGTALSELKNEKVDNAGWTPDKFLGTDENGNVIVKDAMAGGLTSDPQEDESAEAPELGSVPINADQLGGVDASGYLRTPETAVDANIPTSIIMRFTDSTLNTPAKQGITSAQVGLLISVSTGSQSYNGQLAIMSGESSIYIRNKYPEAWTAWTKK